MKKILFLFLLLGILFIYGFANATSTITPNVPAPGSALASSVVRNNFNAAINDINALQSQFPVGVSNGGTGATTSQGALNNLFSAPAGTAAPITVPCGSTGGAEQAFAAVMTSDHPLYIPFNHTGPCEATNQVMLPYGSIFTIAGQFTGANDTTTNSTSGSTTLAPQMLVNTAAIQSNAPGDVFIDAHLFKQITLNGQNFFGTSQTPPSSFVGTNNSPNQGGGQCCDWNTVTMLNTSIGNFGTDIGCAVDNTFNCIQIYGINSYTLSSAGSGYVPGNHPAIPLTGGSGSGATMFIGVNPSGNVNVDIMQDFGTGYVPGDVLGATIGTSGSGFSVTVNSVYGSGALTGASILNGGAGYVPNTYNSVPLTTLTGSGSGAFLSLTINGSGVASAINFIAYGNKGYKVGDTLTVNNSSLGGTGSGLVITVTSVSPATYNSGVMLPHLINDFLSNTFCMICGNISDVDISHVTFSGGAIGLNYIFGAAEGRIIDNRFETITNGTWIGVTNPGFVGATIFADNIGTDFFGEGIYPSYFLDIGKGTGYVVGFNHNDDNSGDPPLDPSYLYGSVANAVARISTIGNISETASGRPSGYKILNSVTDYLFFSGNQVFGSGIQEAVDLSQAIPTHFVWDGFDGGSGSAAFKGRVTNNYPEAINVLHNTNTLDVGGAVAIGTGTSYAGIGTSAGTVAPLNGAIIEGKVGIGTNNPSALLQVGSVAVSGVVFDIRNSSGDCTYAPGASSPTVTCSSDAELKKDITASPSALDWLSDIKVRDFTIKATGERVQGVVAQEMLKHHEDMVHRQTGGNYGVDTPNPWIFVKAIQEQQWEIRLLFVLVFLLFGKVTGIFVMLRKGHHRLSRLEDK